MKLTVDGRSAYAYTGGKAFDPALPCVVFVHGALDDHSVWTLLARWFAHHGFGVLAVDLPGHGRSAGAPLARVQDHADWCLALLRAAGAERAAWVGHSMGSLIALEAAARAGAQASALVMLATAYPMKVNTALLELAREQPLQAIAKVNSYSFSSWASKPGYPGPGSWLHGSGLALSLRQQALGQAQGVNLFTHDFGVCDAYDQGMDAARQVRCPVDFILGRDDQMTLAQASTDLASALKARVQTLPAGHQLMAQAPDAVLRALRSALN